MTRYEILNRVLRLEAGLRLFAIDHFNVRRRRNASRRLHLGTLHLINASDDDLKAYATHLAGKYQKWKESMT